MMRYGKPGEEMDEINEMYILSFFTFVENLSKLADMGDDK